MTPSKRLQSCLLATMAFVAVLLLAVVLTPTSTAQQQPTRLALLIGNKGYTAKVGPLRNPHTDVDLVEASLKRLGFKVTVLKDASYKQMDTALKRYVAEVRRAGKGALSFFYYSGHGVANPENGLNYLIPVDVADADDDKVWFESFQQNVIIDTLSKQAPGATHYLVFDACRNELNVAGDNAKALGADKGFVPVADTAGLLIAYATAPKRTASDAGDGGGPYAKVLAEELVKPGVESVTMFRNVQIKVKQSIGQDPWLSFPSLPPVYLAGQIEAHPAKQPEPPLSAAAREWQDVKGSSNRAVLEAFRKRHERDPVYAALADEAIAAQKGAGVVPPEGQIHPSETTPERAVSIGCKGLNKQDCETRDQCSWIEPITKFLKNGAPTAAYCRLKPKPKAAPAAGATAALSHLADEIARTTSRDRLVEIAEQRPELTVTAEARLTALGYMKFAANNGWFWRKPGAGEAFRDCSTCPEMVMVPAGSFRMGSPENEEGRGDDEGPVREVTIRAPFAVGKFEVTIRQYLACVAAKRCRPPEWDDAGNNSHLKTGSRYALYSGFTGVDQPIVGVSWNDATAYAAWLSEIAKQSYRLLTEAEWEYAARGVTSASAPHPRYHSGDDEKRLGDFAWYRTNAVGKTKPVGGKQPNAFGLHDMHGNVREWVEDCWIVSYKTAPADSSARTSSCADDKYRVVRGGSWYDYPQELRSAFRLLDSAVNRIDYLGFRVARSVSR